MVPKTAPKSLTSPLKFFIDSVYAGRLKCPRIPPRLSRPWQPPLPEQPPQPIPRPVLLSLDSLVVTEAQVIVVLLLSRPLIPAAVEDVSAYVIIIAYLSFWIMFNLHSYPCSV